MAIFGRPITPIMAMKNMDKMYINGENGFEKDSSYGLLWSKQKKCEKKWPFQAISLVKLVES